MAGATVTWQFPVRVQAGPTSSVGGSVDIRFRRPGTAGGDLGLEEALRSGRDLLGARIGTTLNIDARFSGLARQVLRDEAQRFIPGAQAALNQMLRDIGYLTRNKMAEVLEERRRTRPWFHWDGETLTPRVGRERRQGDRLNQALRSHNNQLITYSNVGAEVQVGNPEWLDRSRAGAYWRLIEFGSSIHVGKPIRVRPNAPATEQIRMRRSAQSKGGIVARRRAGALVQAAIKTQGRGGAVSAASRLGGSVIRRPIPEYRMMREAKKWAEAYFNEAWVAERLREYGVRSI